MNPEIVERKTRGQNYGIRDIRFRIKRSYERHPPPGYMSHAFSTGLKGHGPAGDTMYIQRTSVAKAHKLLEKKVGSERASNFIHARILDPIEHETIHQVLDRRLGGKQGRAATEAFDHVRVDQAVRGGTQNPHVRILKRYSYYDENANESHQEKVAQGLRRTGFGQDFIDRTPNRLLSEPYALKPYPFSHKKVVRVGEGENRTKPTPEERQQQYKERRHLIEVQLNQFNALQAQQQRHATPRKTGTGEDLRIRKRRRPQIGDNLLELAGGFNW